MTIRKGVLGGTFNPPHLAHLIVAHIVREARGLDHVVLVPSHRHPFKGEAAASPTDRALMVELAVAGDAGLAADRIEVQRGGISYTVETLRLLQEREPDTDWTLCLGRDLVDELPAWREVGQLAALAEIVVVTRGGVEEESPPRLPDGTPCRVVPVPALGISSTVIRERVAAGRSIRYWVPPGVEAFIHERGLYRPAGDGPGGPPSRPL
ncbi:MAG: nicotinate-nucleotide adenylyltransferase [Gemmatimonadota bacterium]